MSALHSRRIFSAEGKMPLKILATVTIRTRLITWGIAVYSNTSINRHIPPFDEILRKSALITAPIHRMLPKAVRRLIRPLALQKIFFEHVYQSSSVCNNRTYKGTHKISISIPR